METHYIQPDLNLYTCINPNTWQWALKHYCNLKYDASFLRQHVPTFTYKGRPGPFLGDYFSFTYSA
jgi:hypothetical protein